MVIDQLIANVEAIDFSDVIQQSVEQTTNEFIETQEEQLLHGINAEGEQIGTYKNAEYADQKFILNPLAGHGNVDLKLSGSFYQGIVIEATKDAVIVDSIDSKRDSLIRKYSKNGQVLGLSPLYIPKYLEAFSPVADDIIISKIHSNE